MGALAIFAAVLAFQTPAAVDRSGEPRLKELLQWARGLDNVHIIIEKTYRESDSRPFYPDSRLDVWISGPRFRLETSNMWDGTTTMVGDGKTVMFDGQSDWAPVILANAGKTILESMDAVGQAPIDHSPFLALLGGPDSIAKLAPKESRVIAGAAGVVVSHAKLGEVQFYTAKEKGKDQVVRVDFDNLPWLTEQFNLYPEWWSEPDKTALNRHEIIIRRERMPGGLFATKPPKGRPVEDRRKKGKSGGPGGNRTHDQAVMSRTL